MIQQQRKSMGLATILEIWAPGVGWLYAGQAGIGIPVLLGFLCFVGVGSIAIMTSSGVCCIPMIPMLIGGVAFSTYKLRGSMAAEQPAIWVHDAPSGQNPIRLLSKELDVDSRSNPRNPREFIESHQDRPLRSDDSAPNQLSERNHSGSRQWQDPTADSEFVVSGRGSVVAEKIPTALTQSAPLSDTAQAVDGKVICSRCGKLTAPGKYCRQCGAPQQSSLGGDVGVTRRLAVQPSQLAAMARPRMTLSFPECDKQISLPNKPEILIGRPDSLDIAPDIDLTPYGGLARGVSRRHARLRIEQETITLEALGTTNSTSINNRTLAPGEFRQLKDGDTLLFGQLAAVIHVSS
jgi:hypothetical protein